MDKKIYELHSYIDKRVTVKGWVSRVRDHRKIIFLILRDGTGYLQIVLTGSSLATFKGQYRETTIEVTGIIKKDERAISGLEMQAEVLKILGSSSEEIESIVTEESTVLTKLDQRHIVLREGRIAAILKARSCLLKAFRDYYFEHHFCEITPPTIVSTQCEGGSTLFSLQYYDKKAYLTQSSQMYLEAAVPGLGDVYCIAPSFRAEKSMTRRHLSEYTHVEAEMPFITFDQLLDHIEDLVTSVLDKFYQLYPSESKITFTKPFKRMTYKDAIQFCQEHKIYKEEDTQTFYEYGDDIPEKPERMMIDMIGEPVFLCKFPRDMKAFYMKRCDQILTESVDLLLPGCGEIVGGSMRISDLEELKEECQDVSLDDYYWYFDLRRFGSGYTGGYGLGLERFLMVIMSIDHIRDTCIFPRYVSRLSP